MSQVTRGTKSAGGTDFTAHTSALASEINTDLNNLINAHNQHDDGTLAWQRVKATNASNPPLVVNNGAGTNDIAQFQDNGTAVLTVADGGATAASASGAASTALTAMAATGGTGKALVANNSTSTGNIFEAQDNGSAVLSVKDGGQVSGTYISHWMGYRRPNLKWISITQVDVENNTSTANQTKIVFSDGEVRSVAENTGSTNVYRRFDITATAAFASGTIDSGLRSGLSETANTRYAIYAVKCTKVGEEANFVLVGDTTFPTQANFATLDSRYGANGWVFLQYISNGDGAGATSDIAKFDQAGPVTLFRNIVAASNTGFSFDIGSGYQLNGSASAATVTWTYAAGSGAQTVPDTVTHLLLVYAVSAPSSGAIHFFTSDTSTAYQRSAGGSVEQYGRIWVPAAGGAYLTTSGGAAQRLWIICAGWIDGALSGGINPLI